VLLAAALFAVSPVAPTAPCTGFTDVDSASPFCPNVEWLKNRGITLGCTSTTLYCPSDPVIRLAMAAFLNRLAYALRPVRLANTDSLGAQTVNANPVVCRTRPYPVTDFPRSAHAEVTLGAVGSGPGGMTLALVMSVDSGVSWTQLATEAARGVLATGFRSVFTHLGSANLSVGQTVIFGAQLGRGGLPGAGNVTSGQCSLQVSVYSRDGASSPF
jgi:hypothetical protein